ncbi:MAG: tRNA (adenosine(37)-N6)-dimethylallyltransferase MiaA [Defluviitaleaceae bacterium]|nr:tRNA (adenosine(37)-N6)-dimethylallyltransferase MiaA [Defluviitaleaceae bacterium]
MSNTRPLIVIGGATAVGKSKLAIELAKQINGEIISADSIQVYRYMDIGTAKPTKEEMNEIKHHMVDVVDPDEDFSVAVYQKICKECISCVIKSGKIPILVGGTGFYINSVIYDNEFSEETINLDYRHGLYECAKEKGNEYLHDMLTKIDPESAVQVHFNNVKRVVRAIEFFNTTGIKISEHNAVERSRSFAYDVKFFIANMNREKLYSKINKRVDQMLGDGLLEEVRGLLAMGYTSNLTSMQGIGYKELIPYINGEVSLEDAASKLKQNTRHYAKRQLTWFRNQTEAIWFDTGERNIEEIVNEQKRILEEGI